MLNIFEKKKCEIKKDIYFLEILNKKSSISFYSYDTRGNHAGTPSHWKDEEILENRAIFRTIRTPAELVIKPVKVTIHSPFYRGFHEILLRVKRG